MNCARGNAPGLATGLASLWVGLLALAFAPTAAVASEPMFGAFGPEGARMREQLWVLPSGDANFPMRATVFRPASDPSGEDKQRPLVVINHGTDEATRLSVSMPVYYYLSRWFVDRGYVVVLPQRRGHGATGGPLAEAIGNCAHPDHYASGNVAADDIQAAVKFMTEQPFVAHDGAIVVGVSTGGWASLALSARNLPQVQAIVNFAGGRGGHAYGELNAICDRDALLSAARMYATHAQEPTIWFYAKNDSYFGPKFAEDLAQTWSSAGGSVEEHILQPYGNDGHSIADDRQGWDIWGPSLDSFLQRVRDAAPKSVEMADDHGSRSPVMIETSTITPRAK